ncbi:hypothetical protein ATANTOWER_023322, partial [Ataeniobius toweri]|nr:hypothetical protein [Ataeniobius toweri]
TLQAGVQWPYCGILFAEIIFSSFPAAGGAGSTRAGHPESFKPEESGFTLRTQTSSHRLTVRLCPRQLSLSEQTTPSPAGSWRNLRSVLCLGDLQE